MIFGILSLSITPKPSSINRKSDDLDICAVNTILNTNDMMNDWNPEMVSIEHSDLMDSKKGPKLLNHYHPGCYGEFNSKISSGHKQYSFVSEFHQYVLI
jgi:hypothetical protein